MTDAQSLEVIVSFFRYSAISIFLLLGVVFLRDFSNRQVAWLGAWASISGATYLICTSPMLNAFFGPAMIVIHLFCHSGQIAIWLFSLTQFKDRLKLWPVYIGIGIVFYLLGRLDFDVLRGTGSVFETPVNLAYSAMRYGLIAHMVYVAWEGRDEDLLEDRRKFRLIYIVAITLTSLAITSVETFVDETLREGTGTLLLQSVGMWVLAVMMAWFGINLRKVAFITGRSDRPGVKTTEPEDPNERHDLATIEKLVETDKLYLQPGLTIAGLADSAGLPEHRLRRLINKHLGYRNFADFLNHYRITAAQARLSAISDRNVPVLTIAMDLGYGSLGPFNRAFKERTGFTPTEYRRQKLADS
ncbi:MAG: AraC family transcriptional regulator [Kordiimonadaceae bacterium]|nr:AraC family transcriptional regulator [Kordiimonadaceae bacterium]MBO6569368.1 AraC family transcriptional regulator [Kordiimonadaceae bacterium]MBO6964843.1 AraC family transcriptional regulator [Kordiimonadaceae bacterium]